MSGLPCEGCRDGLTSQSRTNHSEDRSRVPAIDKNGWFGGWAFAFLLGSAELPFVQSVRRLALCLPRGGRRDGQNFLALGLHPLDANLNEGVYL